MDGILERSSLSFDWKKALARAEKRADVEDIFQEVFGTKVLDECAIETILEKIADPETRSLIEAGLRVELAAINNRYARQAHTAVVRGLERTEVDPRADPKASDTRLYIPGRNTGEEARYELAEADDIQASHLPEEGFGKNPKYTLENERLYHKEAASQAKVLNNALNLNPDFLLRDSVDANNGAPVVDQENNVLGGNSRVMSLRKAYQDGGKPIEAYKEALKQRVRELGISESRLDAMRQPVLIRRLQTAYGKKERQDLVAALNNTFTDSKDSRAAGKSRGNNLSRDSLMALGTGLVEATSLRDFFDSEESVAVVEKLIRDGVIQATERNAFISADGMLNSNGKNVVEEALRGRVANTYEALARLPPLIVGKIDAIAPFVIIAEMIGGDWDISRHIRDAVDIIAEYKGSPFAKSGDFNSFLNSIDVLKEKTILERFSKIAVQLFILLLNGKKRDLALRFRKFASDAANFSQAASSLPGFEISAAASAKKNLDIVL